MKKFATGDSLETRISRFLFWNRLTPHSTTDVPPAELLLGRIPRSQLDLLKPQLSTRVQQKQDTQKKNHDVHVKPREFRVGELVFIKDFPSGKQWLPGSVSEVKGPLSYCVTLSDGRVVRRHVDHIRSRTSQAANSSTGNESDIEIPTAPSSEASPVDQDDTDQAAEQPQPCRSARARGAPDFLRY